jgi:hypothetical protein
LLFTLCLALHGSCNLVFTNPLLHTHSGSTLARFFVQLLASLHRFRIRCCRSSLSSPTPPILTPPSVPRSRSNLPVEALPRRPLYTPSIAADQLNSTISAPIECIFSRAPSLEEGEIEETNILEEGEILEHYPTPNWVFLLMPAPSTIESYTSTHIATEGALSETYTPINNRDSEGFARLSNGSDNEQSLHWEEYIAEREAAYKARYEAEHAIYEV